MYIKIKSIIANWTVEKWMFSFLIKAKICLNIPTSNSKTLVFPSVLWNWYDARMGLLRLLDFDQRGNQAEFSAE